MPGKVVHCMYIPASVLGGGGVHFFGAGGENRECFEVMNGLAVWIR